jgi:uncharacterized protein YdcH (DUF465 family)
MNDEEFYEMWKQFDTRITTINERTKSHTIQISELKKEIKEVKDARGITTK